MTDFFQQLFFYFPGCGPTLLPLHAAAQSGNLTAVVARSLELEDNGLTVNSQSGPSCDTALTIAAANGHLDVVRFLVETVGADVETTNGFGSTPLHQASSKDYACFRSLFRRSDASRTSYLVCPQTGDFLVP